MTGDILTKHKGRHDTTGEVAEFYPDLQAEMEREKGRGKREN